MKISLCECVVQLMVDCGRKFSSYFMSRNFFDYCSLCPNPQMDITAYVFFSFQTVAVFIISVTWISIWISIFGFIQSQVKRFHRALNAMMLASVCFGTQCIMCVQTVVLFPLTDNDVFANAGKFVMVKGTVVRVSSIKPLCTTMAYECISCRHVQVS